ncbi:MAG: glycosyltransferase, partial [Bacteroidia bacterium]
MKTTPASDVNKNTLLIVGTLGGKQGLPVILDALLLLKNTGLRVNLCCVGHVDDAVNNILDTSESYKQIKEQVIFAGYKKFPDAYKNIENCSAGLALREDQKNLGSHSSRLFEYMVAGLPVICPDTPLNLELIAKCHCGICVD